MTHVCVSQRQMWPNPCTRGQVGRGDMVQWSYATWTCRTQSLIPMEYRYVPVLIRDTWTNPSMNMACYRFVWFNTFIHVSVLTDTSAGLSTAEAFHSVNYVDTFALLWWYFCHGSASHPPQTDIVIEEDTSVRKYGFCHKSTSTMHLLSRLGFRHKILICVHYDENKIIYHEGFLLYMFFFFKL